MSAAAVDYAARRYSIMSRGALHMLARLRDDLKKADLELEGDLSVWGEEVEFLHQALYDALDDLDSALNPREPQTAKPEA